LHDNHNEYGHFLIEMAPKEEYPHVVYWFLEQVRQQLFDGTTFYRNSPHILLAGPQPNFLTPPDVDLNQRFEESGMPSVMFQEFSDKWGSHREYTLGLAGRPAGPYFYINLQDNSELHGPGGQGDPFADPCFARVIDGFDSVARMQRSQLEHINVAITSMRIVQQ
jgi:cyclophilin family peptidyl-prolyl cis-trans isomerase